MVKPIDAMASCGISLLVFDLILFFRDIVFVEALESEKNNQKPRNNY